MHYPSRLQYQDAEGEILRLRAIGHCILSEHLYPAGMVLPKHAHHQVYFTFVLEGSFREKSTDGTLVCRPGSIRFLPAGEIHEDVIETRLRCLHIKAEASMLEELDRHSVVPRRPAEISGLTATWLANRLYAEFSREDCASSIAVEGLVLEILAEIARTETKPRPALVPNWLKHATDIVQSRLLQRLSLAEIASAAVVHSLHLSR